MKKNLLILVPPLAAALLAAVGMAQHATPAAVQRPNVLMINMDDLNDWIGPLGGHPQVKTPNLDRLAARGTVFTNAHTQAPVCNPSRASLFTGIRPEVSGLYALDPSFRKAEALRHLTTLPQLLMKNGYVAYSTGKNFHGNQRVQEEGLPPEFTEWGVQPSLKLPPEQLVQGVNPLRLIDWGLFDGEDADQSDSKIAEWAVAKIKEDPKEPFFLGVGFALPHVPMYATQKWLDLYPLDKLILPIVPPEEIPSKEHGYGDIPKFAHYLHWRLPEPRLAVLQRKDAWRTHVQAYLATVSFADELVGKLLDALDSTEAGKRTIIIFFSDHGYHNGEKGITGKNTLWETATRVPMIISAPGFKAGQHSGQPVELLDMYPTIAELCGLEVPAHVQGMSLVPWIKNPDLPKERPARTVQGPGNMSVRSKNWRYIRYADGSQELYDHVADPKEWHNLAAIPAYADIIREHAKWIPAEFARPVPGSRSRLLDYQNGIPIWEGKAIGADDEFDYDPYAEAPPPAAGRGGAP